MRARACGLLCVLGIGLTLFVSSAVVRGEQRTWKAATGDFTTIAEFVELKDNKVTLRKADGSTMGIPLDKLSTADQAFAQQLAKGQTSAPAATKPVAMSEEDGQRALKALDKEAQLCRTAEEASLLYNVFVADESIPMSVRSQARAKEAEWQAKADKGMVRHGSHWVTVDEVRNARIQAAFLISQGVEMVRLNQNQIGLEKLMEASKTDPDGIQADFVIATIYAINAKNYTKACQHYDICMRRDPNNVAVLNNLALCELRRAEFGDAVNHWKRAATLRYDQRMAQNIGRVLDAAGQRRLSVPTGTLKQLSDVYASMVVANKVFGTDKGRGWNYMLIPMPDPEDVPDPSVTAAINNNDPNALTYLGAGTGFCVADKYILTTRTATKGGSVFLVSNPNEKGQMLTATLVASSKDTDLALLKCDNLAVAPIPIDYDIIYRPGNEVSVLSYAVSDMLGVDVKSSHGVIVMPPSIRYANMLQYNAPTVGSNGGPVVDSMGNVIAMHCRGFDTKEIHYASGIPILRAVLFMREAVPDIDLKQRNIADRPWTQIDDITAKSTVLIVTKGKAQDIGLADKGQAYLEDNSCIRCNGSKKVRCTARGCTNGRVPKIQSTRGSDPVSGRSFTEEVTVRVACNVCNGTGEVTCPDCHGGGLDPTFGRGGRAPILPPNVKARSTLNQ